MQMLANHVSSIHSENGAIGYRVEGLAPTVKMVLLGPCHVAVKEGTLFSLKKTNSTGM